MPDSLELILCSFSTHPESPVIESVLYSFLRKKLGLSCVDMIDDESILIDLAKNNGQYKSSGFVNAILRKLADNYENINLPNENTKEYLSVKN